MISELGFFVSQSALETIAILSIASILNRNVILSIGKIVLYVIMTSVLSVILSIIQPPIYLFFSMVIIIGSYLIIKRPSLKYIGNYIIDMLLSLGVLALLQLLMTAIFSIFRIDLFENNLATTLMLTIIIIIVNLLSTKVSIHIFFETYYLPYRVTVFFSVASLLFLLTVIGDLIFYHEEVFALSGTPRIILMMTGYIIVNLLYAISLFYISHLCTIVSALFPMCGLFTVLSYSLVKYSSCNNSSCNNFRTA